MNLVYYLIVLQNQAPAQAPLAVRVLREVCESRGHQFNAREFLSAEEWCAVMMENRAALGERVAADWRAEVHGGQTGRRAVVHVRCTQQGGSRYTCTGATMTCTPMIIRHIL